MHGSQEQVRPALADGRFANQRQDLWIVSDAAADGVIGDGPVAGGPLRKDAELFREG